MPEKWEKIRKTQGDSFCDLCSVELGKVYWSLVGGSCTICADCRREIREGLK